MRVISSRAFGSVRRGLCRTAATFRWARSAFARAAPDGTAARLACAEGLEARRLLAVNVPSRLDSLPVGPVALTGGEIKLGQNSQVISSVAAVAAASDDPQQVRQDFVAGMDTLLAAIPRWAELFDLPRFGVADLRTPVVQEELNALLAVSHGTRGLVAPEVRAVTSMPDLVEALESAGLEVLATEGGVGGKPAAPAGEVIRARLRRQVDGLRGDGGLNDGTAALLPDLPGSAPLSGALEWQGVLDLTLDFGVGEAGFFVLGSSALDLNVTGGGGIAGTFPLAGDLRINAGGATSTAPGGLSVRLAGANPAGKFSPQADPVQVLAPRVDGTVGLTLDLSLAPLDLRYPGAWVLTSAANSLTVTADVDFPTCDQLLAAALPLFTGGLQTVFGDSTRALFEAINLPLTDSAGPRPPGIEGSEHLNAVAGPEWLEAAWARITQLLNWQAVHKDTQIGALPLGFGPHYTAGDALMGTDLLRERIADLVRSHALEERVIRIGVISDGALGAAGNADLPAGRVTINPSFPGGPISAGPGAGAEGTAMMEILFDIVPDAQLFFTGIGDPVGGPPVDGATAFVQGLQWLLDVQGVDIIVDDIGFFDEPWFEDGPVAQAVGAAAERALYVTAAGNNNGNHYQATFQGQPRGDGRVAHAFGLNSFMELNLRAGEKFTVHLQWDEPFSGATTDFNLELRDGATDALIHRTHFDPTDPAPYRAFDFTNGTTAGRVRVAIVAPAQPAGPRTVELMFNPGFDIGRTNTPSDQVFGHSALPNVLTVGAIDVGQLYNQVAQYSSRGPALTRFGLRTAVVDVLGPSRVQVSGAENFPSTFGGTSAAAPHVAGLAALLMKLSPAASRQDIINAIKNNATDVTNGPVVMDDLAFTVPGETVNVQVLDLDGDSRFENDFDLDWLLLPPGAPRPRLTIVAATAADGTVTVDPTGQFLVYTADAALGSFYTAFIDYTVRDESGATANGEVRVEVGGAPRYYPRDDAFAVPAGQPTVLDLTSNDLNPDGLDIVAMTVDYASRADELIDNGDGTVTFTPEAGFTGLTIFRAKFVDELGRESYSQVAVEVVPSANPPQTLRAMRDVFIVPAQVESALDVLTNDLVPPGESLSIVAPNVRLGRLEVRGGKIFYTPSEGLKQDSVTFTFTYKVGDGSAVESQAEVEVIVDASAGYLRQDDVLYAVEGSARSIDLAANDLDPEGFTFSLLKTTGLRGLLDLNPGGVVTFTPHDGVEGDAGRVEYQATAADGRKVRGVLKLFALSRTLQFGPDEASGHGIVNGVDASLALRPATTVAALRPGPMGTFAAAAHDDDRTGGFDFESALAALGFEITTACTDESLTDLLRGVLSGNTDIFRVRYRSDPLGPGYRADFGFDGSGLGAVFGDGFAGTVAAEFLPLFDIDIGLDARGMFFGASTRVDGRITGTVGAAGDFGGFGVSASGSLSLDPRLSLGGTDANGDGKVRIDEFLDNLDGLQLSLAGAAAAVTVALSSDLLDYVDADGDSSNNTVHGGDPFRFAASTSLVASASDGEGFDYSFTGIDLLNPDVDRDGTNDFTSAVLVENFRQLARDVVRGRRELFQSEVLGGFNAALAPLTNNGLGDALGLGAALVEFLADNVQVLHVVEFDTVEQWLNAGLPATPQEVIRLELDLSDLPLTAPSTLNADLRDILPAGSNVDGVIGITDAHLTGALVFGFDTGDSPVYLLTTPDALSPGAATALGAGFTVGVNLSGRDIFGGALSLEDASASVSPTVTVGFTGAAGGKLRLGGVEGTTGVQVVVANATTLNFSAESAALFPADARFAGGVEGVRGTIDVATSRFILAAEVLDVDVGAVHVRADNVQLRYDPASVDQSLLSVATASATFSLLGDDFTFTATGLNLRRDGTFEFTSATLAGNNLLALADFMPLSVSFVSLQGIGNRPAAFDAFRLSVDGQFSDTLFQNELPDPGIRIGEVAIDDQPPTPVLVEAGAAFGLGVEVDGRTVRLLGPGGRRLGGLLTVGFEHLDLGGFEVDASLTLGGFTNGVYSFNAIGVSGAVRAGQGAGDVSFDPDNNPDTAGLGELGFGGDAVIEDAGNGNRRLHVLNAHVTTSFDTGPGGLAQLRVDSFTATFDFQWTLGPQFQFVNSSFDFVSASASDVFVRFGEVGNEVLRFHATGATFNFRNASVPWMTFTSMSASMPALEDLLVDDDTGQSITGTVSNFAIGRNLEFVPLASDDAGERFGVVFDGLPAPSAVGLPDWLPFRIEEIGLEFGERALSGEALDVILIVSAGFNTPADLDALPIQFEASVSDMRVNLGVLADLFDPNAPDPTALDLLGAVSFGGFSVGVERINIGDVVEIRGALALRAIDYPGDDGVPGNADDRKVLVGTVAGFFGMAGFSGGVELTITEVGPVVGKLDVPLGIPLGPTGLLLSGVSGGFRFGGARLGGVLPTGAALLDLEPGAIAKALLGSGSGIFDPLHVTDDIIDAQVVELVRAGRFTWDLPFTLALSGEIATVASPGVLSGDVTLAAQVDPSALGDGEAPEIRFVGSGDVEVFGIPVGGVGALLDLSDPFDATYYLAAAVPLPGSFLSFLFPAQATLDMVVSTGGLFEAPIVGLRAFLSQLTSPGAQAQLRESLDALLAGVINSLRGGPPRPSAALLLPLLANKPANMSEIDWLVQRLVNLLPVFPGGLPQGNTPSAVQARQSLADVVNALLSEFFFVAPQVFVQTNADGEPVRGADGNLVFRDEWFDLAETLASVMADATRQGLLAAWDSFNPTFVANARLTPTIFGIPFGDEQGFDLRITKDGVSFGGNTTLNTIVAALNPGGPIAGALQSFTNLTDIEFDVEFAIGGIDGLFRTIIGGDFPAFDLDLNVSGKIFGSVAFLGFDLAAVSGLVVSPRSPLLVFPSEDAVSNGDLLRVYKLPGRGVDPATGAITIPPNLSALIPIATESDYDALRLYGGLLLTGQIFTPLMLADPVGMIEDGLAMTQFGAQGLFTPPADLLAEGASYVERVRQHLFQNREMARFQVYVPSPARLVTGGPNGEPPATPAELFGAAYARGFLTSELLSVPLGQATLRVTSDGLRVEGELPWLLGVEASFVLGRRSIGLTGLVGDFAEKFGFAGLNLSHVPAVSVDVPFASLTVDLNSDRLADLIENTFGLPAAFAPGSGSASLALYSPAFADPLDTNAPLFQRVGGIVLDATLNIDQFIENARFHFDAPLFSGSVVPSFHALASVDRIRVPGLGFVANDIIDARLTVEITSENDDLDVSIDGSLKVLRLIDAGVRGTLHAGDDGVWGDFQLTDATGDSEFLIDAGFFQLSGTFLMRINTTGQTVDGIPASPLFVLRSAARLSVFGGIEVEDDRTYNGIVFSGSVGMSFTKDAIVLTGGVDLLADFPFPLPSFGDDTDGDAAGVPDRGIGATATLSLLTNTNAEGGRSSIVGGSFTVHTPLGDTTFSFDRFGAINDFFTIPFVGSTDQHVYVDDQRFNETNGTRSRDIVVSLSKPAERDIEITYTFAPGSALRGTDFNGSNAAFGDSVTVTVEEGEDQVIIPFDVMGDLVGERDERFRFTILSARHLPRDENDNSLPALRQPDGAAWITIVDDDPRDVIVDFRAAGGLGGSAVDDGNGDLLFRGALLEGAVGAIRVSATNLSAQDRVLVRYRLIPLDPSLRTATAGQDFFAGSGGQGFEGLITLVGSATREINITAPQDFDYELDEEFELRFELVEAARNAPSTVLSASGARVAVTNDDLDMPGGTLVFYDFDDFIEFGGGHHFTPTPTYIDPLVVAGDFRHSGETPPGSGAIANSALRFGGGIDHARGFATSAFTLPTNAFTIDFWIRPERFDGTDTVVLLGGAFDGSAAGLSVFLDHTAPLQRLVRYRMRNTAGADFVGTLGSFQFNQWQHVTLVYGGGTAGVSGFVNGASTGGGPGSGAVSYAGQSVTLGAGADFLRDNYLGSVDELRVWTTALGAAQVATLPGLNTTGAESNLLINYRFDEGSGGTAVNATGRGWNARLGSGGGIFGEFGRPDWVVPNISPVNAFPRYATASSGVLAGVPKVPPVSPTADPSFAVTSSLWSPPGTDISQARFFTFGVGRDVPTAGGVVDFRQMLALRFEGIDFFERAAVDGPTRWELRSSRDGFAEALAEGVTEPGADFKHHHVIFEESVRFSFIHPTEGIEFRLYGLDATGNGSWRIDNVALFAGLESPAGFNTPPVLPPFSFDVDLGGTAVVDPIGRTTDTDGDPVDVVNVSAPAGAGSLVRSGDVFVFTPASGTGAEVPLTFTVADRWGATVTTVVTARVRGSAIDDGFTTLEDTPLNGSVLGNDLRPSGQSVTVSPVGTLPSSVTLRSDGTFTFVPPPNSTAPVSFDYRLAGPGWSDTARVTIAVTPVNDLPVAVNRSFTVAEDGTLSVPAPGVLTGINDPDGDRLTAVLVSGVSRGTLTFNPDGSFTYVPGVNDDTASSFTYAILDGTGQSNVARVDIDILPVNDLPVAIDRSFSTNEDSTLSVAGPGVLAGVTDVEGSALHAVLVTGPSRGTLTLNADGSFMYVPRSNDDLSDSFTYAVSDGTSVGNPARVTIDLLPINDLPVAINRSFAVNEDTILSVAPPGVLAGVSDPDGDKLTAVLVSGVSRGLLTFNADGSFTYRPRGNDDSFDSFTYAISDGSGNGNIARVDIDLRPVNDVPVARTDSFALDANTTLTVAAPGVLGNDTDVDSASLKALIATGVSHGTLTLNSNGSFIYTPVAGYSGPDGFTYRASDGDSLSTATSVAITVRAVNQPPAPANDPRPAVNESTTSTPTTVTFTVGNILANDTDPEGSPLTVVSVGPPTSGFGTVSASGALSSGTTQLTYTAPSGNFNGTVSIPYTVRDAAGATASASVIITINPTNDAPLAANDSGFLYTLNVSNSNQLTVIAPGVLGNDNDPEQSALTAVLVTQPSHGFVTMNANGSFTYTFDRSTFRGGDPFTYRARDPSGALSAPATVTVSVTSSGGGLTTSVNGYIAYGRLGFDVNNNRVWDFTDLNGNGVRDFGEPGEPVADMNRGGLTSLFVGPAADLNGDGVVTPDEGVLLAFNGTVTATLQPLVAPLTAPAGSAFLTPFTTIMAALMADRGLSDREAQVSLRAAFGIADIDVTATDPIALARAGGAAAGDYLVAHVQLHGTYAQATVWLAAHAGLPLPQVAQGMASAIAARAAAGPLDLADAAEVAGLVSTLAQRFGFVVPAETVAPVAMVIAAGNAAAGAQPRPPAVDAARFVEAVYRVEATAQGPVLDSLMRFAVGDLSADQLLAGTTGAALADLVASAKLGAVNLLPLNGAALRHLAATPAFEGDHTRLTGVVDGAGRGLVSLRINWDDGAVEDLVLPAGQASFAVDHLYADESPLRAAQDVRRIAVMLMVDGVPSDVASVGVAVRNVAPVLLSPVLTPMIVAGGAASLEALFSDPGLLDRFTVDVNWGDGSSAQEDLVAGSRQLSAAHVYGQTGRFTVTLTLADADGGRAVHTLPLEVVAPLTPAVTHFVVDDGSRQRSMVRGFTVVFNQPVDLDAAQVTLRRLGGADYVVTAANPSGDGRTWRLGFFGPGTIGSSLPDGRYELRIPAGAAVGALGTPTGHDHVEQFHRLFGDVDGDADVDHVDYTGFVRSFRSREFTSKYVSQFDFDADGAIDKKDSEEIRARRSRSILDTVGRGSD